LATSHAAIWRSIVRQWRTSCDAGISPQESGIHDASTYWQVAVKLI
jgi:hypothetical protein